MNESTYGSALHKAYVSKGWTQYRLADEVTKVRGQKTSQAYLSNIANDLCRPSRQADEALRSLFPGALPVLHGLREAVINRRPLGVIPNEETRRRKSEAQLKRAALGLKPLSQAEALFEEEHPVQHKPTRAPEYLARMNKEIEIVNLSRGYAQAIAKAGPRSKKYGPDARWSNYVRVLDASLNSGLTRAFA